jgi:hypothetical protein
MNYEIRWSRIFSFGPWAKIQGAALRFCSGPKWKNIVYEISSFSFLCREPPCGSRSNPAQPWGFARGPNGKYHLRNFSMYFLVSGAPCGSRGNPANPARDLKLACTHSASTNSYLTLLEVCDKVMDKKTASFLSSDKLFCFSSISVITLCLSDSLYAKFYFFL